ncbi:hypothetical protein [Pseudoalteromonas sp. S16_S37]|uniref:hypothetical protein n=1 Tax=Pseudoalteromonas sp. S16_S37 TaxID=2720228 RepID=UPI0016811359|nr:hypothetical protein [Pseudoalteromonas sp. S16_S37]MBD1582880.1 hypothetical protein [Pseudoalteromonas sp. S16_S37]
MKTRLLLSFISLAVLVGCGSDKHTLTPIAQDSHDEHTTPISKQPDVILPHGRLAVSHANMVSIYNVEDGSLVESLTTTHEELTLVTSAQGRYVLAMSRQNDLVQFIDSGLHLETTDNKQSLHQDTPSLLSFELYDSKATHYIPNSQNALLFFDGNKDSGTDASFALLSDTSIANNSVLASHHYTTYMHGTGQVRGDWVIATLREPESESSLPSSLGLFELHGDHFHQEQTFEHACPSLHGSIQTTSYIAFACGDGIVKITQHGDTFTSEHIANTAALPEGHRIGKLIGSHSNAHVLGVARGSFYHVDLEHNELSAFNWQPEGIESYLAYGISAISQDLLILDEQGYINVFDSENEWQATGRFKALATISADVPTLLINNQAYDVTYLVHGQEVISLDLKSLQATPLFTLTENTQTAAWAGIPATK